jgi:serine/threonine protein kinase
LKDHENILKMYEDIEVSNGTSIYIVTELCDLSLRRFLMDNGKLSEESLKKFFIQIGKITQVFLNEEFRKRFGCFAFQIHHPSRFKTRRMFD